MAISNLDPTATLAEDGKGVYFLEPTQEQHDDMNRRPVASNKKEELDISKYYNATYYENLSLAPGGEHLEGLLVHDDSCLTSDSASLMARGQEKWTKRRSEGRI